MGLVVRRAGSGTCTSHACRKGNAFYVGSSSGACLNRKLSEKDKVDDDQRDGEDRGQREEPPTS